MSRAKISKQQRMLVGELLLKAAEQAQYQRGSKARLNCFAWKPDINRCDALTYAQCKFGPCEFFKTREEFERSAARLGK